MLYLVVMVQLFIYFSRSTCSPLLILCMTWFSPPPTPRVPKISQETSMATSVPGGYYVNMGKLMENYLLKVYCTIKRLALRCVCGVNRCLFILPLMAAKSRLMKWKTKSH